MPLQAFRRIQIGRESTAAKGTAVAADVVLLGNMTFTPTLALNIPEDEERNSLSMHHRSTIVGQHTAMTFNSNVHFEELPYFLDMGINGDVSPSGGTSGQGRTWTFTKSTTSRNFQGSYTVEYGDDQQAYESPFTQAEQLEFTWAMGEPVTFSATLFGHFETTGPFTGSLAPSDTIETAVSNRTTLYTDTAWANLGNTTADASLVNAVVRIPTGLQRQKYADGSLEFSGTVEGRYAAEVELTYVHNSSGRERFIEYEQQNLRFIRLETLGSTFGSTGGENRTFRVDVAIKYTEPPQLFTDANGENTVVLRGTSFSDTGGNELAITVINTTTTL